MAGWSCRARAAIVEPGPPATPAADWRGCSGPRRRSRPHTEQMAQAIVRRLPPPKPRKEGGVRRGDCPRVRGRLAAGPPGALERKLARAAPGGRDGETPTATPPQQTSAVALSPSECPRARPGPRPRGAPAVGRGGVLVGVAPGVPLGRPARRAADHELARVRNAVQ